MVSRFEFIVQYCTINSLRKTQSPVISMFRWFLVQKNEKLSYVPVGISFLDHVSVFVVGIQCILIESVNFRQV